LITNETAKIFNIPAENMCEVRRRAETERKEGHRLLTLEIQQEADVVNFIQERFEMQNYLRQTDVKRRRSEISKDPNLRTEVTTFGSRRK
jgi:hypothetical protein